jgi:Effector Associated Constant Component 1
VSETLELHIDFPGLTDADSARSTRDLQALLRGADSSLTFHQRSSDPRAQDAGSVLVVLLGSASLVALCRGLGAYASKRGDAIRVRLPEGEVVATGKGVENFDPAKVVAALKSQKAPARTTTP